MTTLLNFLNRYWKQCSVFLLLIIGLLSLLPLPELPAAPGSDKTHHLIAYAVLVIPVAIRKPKFWWLIVVFYLAFSGVIELVQPYVNRYGEWLDMLANSIGIICGLLISELLISLFPAKLKRIE
tara:strand:+ start:191 stop:562 length:372 start_codon:yes stop_codon:yes gene_type:complete